MSDGGHIGFPTTRRPPVSIPVLRSDVSGGWHAPNESGPSFTPLRAEKESDR